MSGDENGFSEENEPLLVNLELSQIKDWIG